MEKSNKAETAMTIPEQYKQELSDFYLVFMYNNCGREQ
jgi:hypothetical protein